MAYVTLRSGDPARATRRVLHHKVSHHKVLHHFVKIGVYLNAMMPLARL